MQADGRFVKNVQNTHQRGADLRGQPYPLALAAGQAARLTAERQIFKADAAQKAEPLADFLEYPVGDQLLFFRERKAVHEFKRADDGLVRKIDNIDAADRDGQNFLFKPPTAAVGARMLGHILLELPPHGHTLRLFIAAFKVFDDAFKRLVQRPLAARLVVVERQLFAVCPV